MANRRSGEPAPPTAARSQVQPRENQSSHRTSRSGTRRLKYPPVLVASLAISATLLSGLTALIVFTSLREKTFATHDLAERPLSAPLARSERPLQITAAGDADRLAPTSVDREQLDQLTRENQQAQLSQDGPPSEQHLRGEPIVASQTFWNNCVDSARQRLTLSPGVHLLDGIQKAAPNRGIDNLIVVGGMQIEKGTAGEHFVSILSCPNLEEVHSLPEEISFTSVYCDVSPSGKFILEKAAVGPPGERRGVLRLHSFETETARDISFEDQLLAMQFVSDDSALLHSKDQILQLFNLEDGTGKQIHQYPGTQLTYWIVTPGKRFVLVFSGGSPALLRVFSIAGGLLREHCRKSLEMEREFVIHHAEISPNGRYLHVGLFNPRANQKRLRIIDLETGEVIQDVDDSELPDSLTFAWHHPTVTNDASWLFPQGKLVASKTLKVTWRAEDIFPNFTSNSLPWYICANNRAVSIQPVVGRAAVKQLLVAELP